MNEQEIRVPSNAVLKFEITVLEYNGIISRLYEFPMKDVRGIVDKLEKQANEQIPNLPTVSEQLSKGNGESLRQPEKLEVTKEEIEKS